MSRELTVESWAGADLRESRYDALVATLGFEERAWFIPSQVARNAPQRFACGFTERHSHAYDDNRARFSESGFQISEVADREFGKWWAERLQDITSSAQESEAVKICMDISSMTRARLARVVHGLVAATGGPRVIVDFVYAIAKYSPPSRDIAPIEVCAPVTPEFAGWWSEPERPAAAIFGLGYEEERAIGAWEYIEPTRVWAFLPTGEDDRYDIALREGNENLWDVLPPSNVVNYRVDDPFGTFTTLEGLVFGTRASSRVIIVPFGPKIFAMCSILVASIHSPFVAVWRVSSGQSEIPANRFASGKVVGIRLTCGEGARTSGIKR